MALYASHRLEGLWYVTLFSEPGEETTWSILWVEIRQCVSSWFAKELAHMHACLPVMHHSCNYSFIRLLHGAKFSSTTWKRLTKWNCRRFPSRLQRICPLPPALSPTPSSLTPAKLSAIAYFWTSKTNSQLRYNFRFHIHVVAVCCVYSLSEHSWTYTACVFVRP